MGPVWMRYGRRLVPGDGEAAINAYGTDEEARPTAPRRRPFPWCFGNRGRCTIDAYGPRVDGFGIVYLAFDADDPGHGAIVERVTITSSRTVEERAAGGFGCGVLAIDSVPKIGCTPNTNTALLRACSG